MRPQLPYVPWHWGKERLERSCVMCECEEQDKASIQSVEELLGMPLTIPSYQRPYQWTARNIEALLSDIERAI